MFLPSKLEGRKGQVFGLGSVFLGDDGGRLNGRRLLSGFNRFLNILFLAHGGPQEIANHPALFRLLDGRDPVGHIEGDEEIHLRRACLAHLLGDWHHHERLGDRCTECVIVTHQGLTAEIMANS